MVKNINKIMQFTMLLLFAFTTTAFAQQEGSGTNIGSMFANFQSSAIAISELINIAAYIMGAFLIISSIFKFTKVGQQGGSLKGALTTLFCGLALFSINSTINIAMQSASVADGATGPGDALMAAGSAGNQQMEAAISGVLTFVKMLGYLAFVRGWMMLNAAGNGKEGALFSGLTHIFGGVMAINFQTTARIVGNTIAPGLTIPGIT